MDIILENKFISILSTIFYAYRNKSLVDVVVDKKKSIFGKEKIKTKPKFLGIEQVEKELISFKIDEFPNASKSVNFITLWQFCQFVRFAEKTLFYHNDIDTSFYIDSEMNDLSMRSFKITDSDNKTDIFCSLERKKESISDKTFSIMKLTIKRNYGKQMTNEFIIVDDFVKAKDDSDKMLIENVYFIIYKNMKECFKNIIQLAIDTAEEMFTGEII